MTDHQNPNDIARPFADTGMTQADHRPRPQHPGTGLLTPDQARSLAQANVDAGADPAVIKAALAADGIEWEPDARTKADREWDEDHAVNRPERYNVPTDRRFAGESAQDQEALAGVTRDFVAQLGFDRSGGSDLAGEITRAIADQRDMRGDARSAYEQRQAAMLGSQRDALVKDAASALESVHPDLVKFMHQSGALSNANVIVALAHMAQARAART